MVVAKIPLQNPNDRSNIKKRCITFDKEKKMSKEQKFTVAEDWVGCPVQEEFSLKGDFHLNGDSGAPVD